MKYKENDLPHELLGKVRGPNFLLVELFRDCGSFLASLSRAFSNLAEQAPRIS